jgi:S-adenosylmethionine uptake transporter
MTDTTPTRAIVLILLAMVAISINDMLIKLLSGGYPLHQMVFVRSVIGLGFTAVFLWAEGGLRLLRTDQPGLHIFRALLIVMANMTFFSALAVLPLGVATALFFVAPLFITLLAIPVLGERVGVHRLAALVVGFAGVGVMMVPSTDWGDVPRAAMLLPVAAAACYAGMQVMTRKLGARSAASAMAIYIQLAFIAVSVLFWITVGDGRLAAQVESESLVFLLRAWIWPTPEDIWKFAVLGLMSGIIGYGLSQAYRLGNAATIASYEYVALPAAIFLGWLVFGERPTGAMVMGTALIAGAGLYVFARERRRSGVGPAAERPIRRG